MWKTLLSKNKHEARVAKARATIYFFSKSSGEPGVNVHARACIPVHSHTFIQINIFSGVLPARPNPKPEAERGANVFLVMRRKKAEVRTRAHRLGGIMWPESPRTDLTLSRAGQRSGKGRAHAGDRTATRLRARLGFDDAATGAFADRFTQLN